MTSSTFSGFWTPLLVPNSRKLPSFGQNLANPLPPPQRRRHMYIIPEAEREGGRGQLSMCVVESHWWRCTNDVCTEGEGGDQPNSDKRKGGCVNLVLTRGGRG